MHLDGKSVVVTGAGSGMGKVAALEYGRRGSNVLVADLDEETATQTATAIREAGGTAECFQMDHAIPGLAAYGAAKAGLVALSRAIAFEARWRRQRCDAEKKGITPW
jgi:NAD(P)-dependent dehydrogenase (short-subunit alcohol dehydrogenase family)